MSRTHSRLISDISDVLMTHTDLQLAILFGSVARGEESRESDVDVALDLGRPFTAQEKVDIIGELAGKTGRPVDLIDLRQVGEPVLGQILKNGLRILGDKTRYAALIRRHLFDVADFMPYRSRILRERRHAWTVK